MIYVTYHIVSELVKCIMAVIPRGVGKGGSEGLDEPPFLGVNLIHFLYKGLEERSVQK